MSNSGGGELPFLGWAEAEEMGAGWTSSLGEMSSMVFVEGLSILGSFLVETVTEVSRKILEIGWLGCHMARNSPHAAQGAATGQRVCYFFTTSSSGLLNTPAI